MLRSDPANKLNQMPDKSLTYEKVLRGEHPDIRYPQKWKRHPNEPANRAINLYLRDIFTSLSLAFYQEILQVTPETIQEIKAQTIVCKGIYTDVIFDDAFNGFIDADEDLFAIPEAQQKLSQDGVWEKFSQYYQYLPSEGKQYFRNLLAHTKHVATLQRYSMEKLVTGKYQEYYWCPTQDFCFTTSHAVDTTLIPIGEYGRECTLKMLYTNNILINLSERFLKNLSEILEKQHWDVVIQETARGQEKHKAMQQMQEMKQCPHLASQDPKQYQIAQKEYCRTSTLDSLKEALHSVQATISSCTAQKMAVFDSFTEHLQAVVDSQLLVKFAKILPFGYTLPVVRRGRYFAQIIESTQCKQQKLRFSKHFRECAEYFKEDYLNTRVYHCDERNPGLLGFGCPAAIKKKGYEKTGIEHILDAYLHIFEKV